MHIITTLRTYAAIIINIINIFTLLFIAAINNITFTHTHTLIHTLLSLHIVYH
jgi:hypothetical protein